MNPELFALVLVSIVVIATLGIIALVYGRGFRGVIKKDQFLVETWSGDRPLPSAGAREYLHILPSKAIPLDNLSKTQRVTKLPSTGNSEK